MSLIKKICETCRYHSNSSSVFPCIDCSSRDRWEVAEDIRVCTKALMELEAEFRRYKQESEKIPCVCEWKNKMYNCEYDGYHREHGYKISSHDYRECPRICPRAKKLKYSTFQAHCNKCGHDTEHEQIQDDSGEMIETVTSCLVCGDHDVDVDSKEQMEDEQRYFEMAGDYDMPDMPESEDGDAGDIEGLK